MGKYTEGTLKEPGRRSEEGLAVKAQKPKVAVSLNLKAKY